jgi:hypothetical protein
MKQNFLLYINETRVLAYNDYFKELIKTGNFAEQYEILNTSTLLNVNIVIYKNFNYSIYHNKYIFDYETLINKDEVFNPFLPTILICWVNGNHTY